MYKSSPTPLALDANLDSHLGAILLAFSTRLVSPIKLFKSPNLTLEFVTPNCNIFLYRSFCFLIPGKGACSAWYANLIAVGSGIIPFAVAKAPALTKLRMCVMGDKIVFAICDVALGYKTKPAYIWLVKPSPNKFLLVSSNASAISSIAYMPLSGLVDPTSNFLAGSKLIALNLAVFNSLAAVPSCTSSAV